MRPRHRVAVVAPHPVQYMGGLWRTMASHPRLDVHVIFLDTVGIDGTVDPTLHAALKWDIPLLEGYSHEFVRNLSPFRFTPVVHRLNPGLPGRLLADRYDAVMVHGHQTLSNWLALYAARRSGARLVYRGEAHGQDRTLPGPVNTLNARIQGFFLRSCAAVAVSCEANRDYLVARGAYPEALFPMPCAVDNEQLQRIARGAAPPQEFCARHGLPEGSTFLISVGRFVDHKRMDDVIAALATPALRDHPDIQLLLVGDGPDRARLEDEARRRGLAERVHFLGFLNQQELVEAIRVAEVFVLASWRDASPKALSEALCLGLPVVCSANVLTSRDLIEPGRNGFVFPCGDLDALAGHLAEILDDPELRRAMGEQSRRIARANDFETGVESLVEKLDALQGAADGAPA